MFKGLGCVDAGVGEALNFAVIVAVVVERDDDCAGRLMETMHDFHSDREGDNFSVHGDAVDVEDRWRHS